MKIIGINIIIILMAITQPGSALINNDSAFNEEEAPLLIEDWMLHELTPNTEAEIAIEDWMLKQLSPANEMEPVIEDWMLEELIQEQEAEPQIESWMLEELIPYEEEIIIEDWMLL